MGHPSRNMEDSSTECDSMTSGALAQEVSEDKNFSMLPRDHSCDILVKSVATFALVQKV